MNTQLWVLVLQRIQAVCAADDDLGRLRLLQSLSVLQRQLLEDELVSGASGGVTGTGLAVAQYGVAHASKVQQFRNRTGSFLGPILEGARAPHPEEVLDLAEVCDVLTDHRYGKRKVLGPVHPPARAHVPRISLALQPLEHSVEL